MKKDHWRLVTSIIDRLLEAKEDDHKDIIERECGDNTELKTEIKKFFHSITKSESLWDELLISNQILVNELTRSDDLIENNSLPFSAENLGTYRLKKRIARGGMGDVFLAERNDGQFQRNVAIKILRNELHSPKHRGRFILEREILSSLEHPNIARLYDGGITENGSPYLVMEYVDGMPISSFCRDNHCIFEKKLELFHQVCSAVQYAHLNLIVHRDLKPDNIYVTDQGIVKILDFGIAKIIDTELSAEKLIRTDSGMRLMSVQYAAPEQITMEKITTATDVYALGLLLYEMLTGHKPLDLTDKKLSEAEYSIRNLAPPKPSTIVVEKILKNKLKGDLDAIILKCLHKEPEDRYSTVDQLLNDLDRYQSFLPVLAKSGSYLYKSKKFFKRQKKSIIAASILVMFLTGFLSYHVSEVTRQKELALQGQQEANFISGFMTDLFKSANPTENIDDTLTVYDLLERGKRKISELDKNFPAKAGILESLAESYTNLGNYKEAEELYNQAFTILNRSNPDQAKLTDLTYRMASMYSSQRNYVKSAYYYDQALQMLAQKPDSSSIIKKASILSGYGNVIAELGNAQLAVLYLEKSLKNFELSNGKEAELRSIKINLAKAYRHNNEYRKSEELYREILKGMDYSESDGEISSGKAALHNNLAYLLKVQSRTDEAIIHYKKALDLHESVYGTDHPITLMILNNLAAAHETIQNFTDAEYLLKTRLERHKNKYGMNHWRTATAYKSLAIFLIRRNKMHEAETMLNEAVNLYTKSLGSQHIWTELTNIYLSFCQDINGSKVDADQRFTKSYQSLQNSISTFSYYDKQLLENLISDLKSIEPVKWGDQVALLESL